MLNVLFVIPRYLIYGNKHYVMPMGILYVSAYIKRSHGANVFTLNLNHRNGDEREVLRKAIVEYKIDLVGLGGLSGEYSDLRRISEWLSEDFPNLLISLGGGIMTADPTTTMRAFPEVTYGIIGEGELTLDELFRCIDGGGIGVEKIHGLAIRKDRDILITDRREEIQDLDSLPIPDFDGFDYGEYLENNPDLSDEGKKYSQVSVIGGRSCKYNCTFCFHPSGSRYRQRSLDSIFHEIDYLVERYDISYIALREELFATDNERVREFCRRVAYYDFDWSIQLRIDNVNDELVSLLEKTRCRYIFLGIESADNDVLKSMRKRITIGQIEKALMKLTEAGLRFRSGVILGDTVETYDKALLTLEWFEKYRHVYSLYADMIIAFPGSTLYKRAIAAGIIPDPVRFLQDGCPVVNVSKMSDEEFKRIVDRLSEINDRRYNVKFYRMTT